MVKLTKAQIYVLERLSAGEKIAYSQDGDDGWFFPSSEWLEIDCQSLNRLRQLRLIGSDPEWEDEGRFGPCDVITPAGRAALQSTQTPK